MSDDKHEEWVKVVIQPAGDDSRFWEIWHRDDSRGECPVAACDSETDADRIIADHNARTQLEERVRELEAALRETTFECPDCARGVERHEGSGWESLNQPWYHRFVNPATGHEKTWVCSSTPANDRARALLSPQEGSTPTA